MLLLDLLFGKHCEAWCRTVLWRQHNNKGTKNPTHLEWDLDCGVSSDVAAELGFEPRQYESESQVLPLHNSAILLYALSFGRRFISKPQSAVCPVMQPAKHGRWVICSRFCVSYCIRVSLRTHRETRNPVLKLWVNIQSMTQHPRNGGTNWIRTSGLYDVNVAL